MDILERLKAATGPDRELDADILEAMGWCAHKETEYYCIEDGNDCDSGFTCKKCGTDTYGAKIERYTASIDAALALVERMLPMRLITMSRDGKLMWSCAIQNADDYGDRIGDVFSSSKPTTPALAILIALFTALQGKDKP